MNGFFSIFSSLWWAYIHNLQFTIYNSKMSNNQKKTALLFAMLLLPVVIYISIKSFGQNHYKMPYYGERSLITNSKDTSFFKLPAFSYTDINKKVFDSKNMAKGYTIIAFLQPTLETSQPLLNGLTQVEANFPNQKIPFHVILLADTDTLAFAKDLQKPQRVENNPRHQYIANKVATQNFVALFDNKLFLPPTPIKNKYVPPVIKKRIFLIDTKGCVRGVYDSSEQKEIDRLMLEIFVLDAIDKGK